MNEPREVDLQLLKDPDERNKFFRQSLESPELALGAAVDFYNAQRSALVDSGYFDSLESEQMAADLAWDGMAKALKFSGTARYLRTVHQLDSIIRQLHDIRGADFPKSHADPLVSSFFCNLEPHLNRSITGDRADGWS